MKKATDPRHKVRIRIVEELFAESFSGQRVFKETATKQILEKVALIDENIKKAATEWPIDKISKIDLAILRLSVYEILIDKSQPVKVIIDEAIEIAKLFGNDRSPSFINGVLGTIVKINTDNDTK